MAAVCDELGFVEEAAVYRKLLTDARQPTVEKASFIRAQSRANARKPVPVAREKRATSNVNTISRTNRLVGVNAKAKNVGINKTRPQVKQLAAAAAGANAKSAAAGAQPAKSGAAAS